uniref:Uncharacterized protein n=1 Tax=Anguilla anguilla TaxID=7936 RepID=A0A0E9V2M2_ANGAN
MQLRSPFSLCFLNSTRHDNLAHCLWSCLQPSTKPLRLLDNQCGNLLVLGYILTKGRTMDSLKVSVFWEVFVSRFCVY